MLKGENVAFRRETLEQLEHAAPSCPGIVYPAGRRAKCFTGKEIIDPSLLFFGESNAKEEMNRAPLNNRKNTFNRGLSPGRLLFAPLRPYRSLSGHFSYKSAGSPTEGDKACLRPLPEKKACILLFSELAGNGCRNLEPGRFKFHEINFLIINHKF
jgi:hypothetical protein